MNFIDLLKKRRSIRKFAEEKLSPEEVELLMKAALMAPTSKNSHSWEFILVDEQQTLDRLALCKPNGAAFVNKAPLAIVIAGDPTTSDVWVEDAAIAATAIQLQAEAMGLGSCWVQVRFRMTASGDASESYIKELLGIPEHISVLAVIAVGEKIEEKKGFDEDRLLWEKLHLNKW